MLLLYKVGTLTRLNTGHRRRGEGEGPNDPASGRARAVELGREKGEWEQQLILVKYRFCNTTYFY
jgi:hypothetical protein